MAASRTGIVLAWVLMAPLASMAQNCNLVEAPKASESYQYSIQTNLTGTMKIANDGKQTEIKIVAKNEHEFLEKVLAVDKGAIRKSARYYDKAISVATLGETKIDRVLREERKLIVAQRITDQLLCYSPAGPMTRAELELVGEHFDTLHLTGLLPGKEVAVGDDWKISNAAAQALCLFEGLVSHDLTGKLKEVKDGVATIGIEGKASGIELGASVRLEIVATMKFDPLNLRIVELNWKQKDTREQGPASPATEVESTTILKRTFLADEPKELSKTHLASVPSEDEPQDLLKMVQCKEPRDRYSLLHAREWHQVGATPSHLVLRLLDRGDFVAQATIAMWKKADAGKHLSAEDFKRLISESPGWELETIVESGEVPTDEGRWLYRITARGELDGTKVVQNFILLAGPQGDQLIVTFTMKPTNAARIGTRDVALVNAIEFATKK